jgi:hypothetical protein
MKIFWSLLLVMTLAVSALARQKGSHHNSTAVSKEFSQAANQALVAIENSSNDEGLTLDPIVQQAFDDANAAALSKPENDVLLRLTLLAAMRPIKLGVLKYTASENERHQKAIAELSKVDGCITAMRKALRSLSGDEPTVCTDE